MEFIDDSIVVIPKKAPRKDKEKQKKGRKRLPNRKDSSQAETQKS